MAKSKRKGAGSGAAIITATTPLGALIGAPLGGVIIANRPPLFLVIVLPLAILFLGLGFTLFAISTR